MKQHITLDLIECFSKSYNDNFMNKIIENAVTENGIEKSCIDKK